MKRVSRRMIFLLVLMAVLVVGLGIFSIQYALHADEWVVFPGSPHVYAGTNLYVGVITDRSGTILMDATEDKVYAEDTLLRSATMHLLGDRFGYIHAPLLDPYADAMVGFNKVTGVYSTEQEPKAAVLTLDAEVQKTALNALEGRKGTIGVYNYRTGEILCAVTSPTYDPDHMPDVEGDTAGAYEGVYLNRFFQTTYVPGSIFKVLTTVAAVDHIPDLQQQRFTCSGSMQIGADTIVCNGVHGTISFQDAFAKSCNCAFADVALQLGKDILTEYAQKLGITSSLQIDGVVTAPGSFDVQQASDGQLAWAGIGQHTNLINACQYMYAMGILGGGGKAAVPYLVQSVSGDLFNSYTAKTAFSEQIISPETAETLRIMMHYNVVKSYGEGRFPPYYVCAKSGTAEVGEDQAPHATFAGYIADETYPLAFIVIVEHGGSGSAVCAPIAGTVLNACVEAMKIS